jgi:hypothetical protein
VPMVSKAQVMALAAGDGWLYRVPISCSLARRAGARALLRQRSVWLSFRRSARLVHARHRPGPAAAGGAPGTGA